jgi:hypothetical protein
MSRRSARTAALAAFLAAALSPLAPERADAQLGKLIKKVQEQVAKTAEGSASTPRPAPTGEVPTATSGGVASTAPETCPILQANARPAPLQGTVHPLATPEERQLKDGASPRIVEFTTDFLDRVLQGLAAERELMQRECLEHLRGRRGSANDVGPFLDQVTGLASPQRSIAEERLGAFLMLTGELGACVREVYAKHAGYVFTKAELALLGSRRDSIHDAVFALHGAQARGRADVEPPRGMELTSYCARARRGGNARGQVSTGTGCRAAGGHRARGPDGGRPRRVSLRAREADDPPGELRPVRHGLRGATQRRVRRREPAGGGAAATRREYLGADGRADERDEDEPGRFDHRLVRERPARHVQLQLHAAPRDGDDGHDHRDPLRRRCAA